MGALGERLGVGASSGQPSLLLPLSRKYGDGRLKIKIFCAGACSAVQAGRGVPLGLQALRQLQLEQ